MIMDRWQYENYMESIERKMKKQTNNQRATNADRIRSMTDEELTDYLIKLTEIIRTCDICGLPYIENGDCSCNCDCKAGVLKWLKSEVK